MFCVQCSICVIIYNLCLYLFNKISNVQMCPLFIIYYTFHLPYKWFIIGYNVILSAKKQINKHIIYYLYLYSVLQPWPASSTNNCTLNLRCNEVRYNKNINITYKTVGPLKMSWYNEKLNVFLYPLYNEVFLAKYLAM